MSNLISGVEAMGQHHPLWARGRHHDEAVRLGEDWLTSGQVVKAEVVSRVPSEQWIF